MKPIFTFRGIEFGRLRSALNDIPLFPATILILFLVVGLLGKAIAPHNPLEANFADTLLPPFWFEGGKMTNFLGTDEMGRDILSRLVSGASVSLQVGFTVISLAGALGCLIALLAGYLGGWVDSILMRLTDTMLSVPYLMIAIVLASVLGPSKKNIIVVLAVMGWAGYARVLRGEVLRVKEKEFVALALIAGCSKTRIMLKHIFPNIINPFIILATLQLGTVIIAESSLSFLGVGVPAPNPAWGLMVAEGRNYIAGAWWICFWPGISILLVVVSSNLLGDWLRIRLDPKFRQV
jgi:peptide/nickel transport system permease protein